MGWGVLVEALGAEETDKKVLRLFEQIGEVPTLSNTPGDYSDPLFKTNFYKFFSSGIEVGFRGGVLIGIHVFVSQHEGYSAYKGEILGRAAESWRKSDFDREFGPAIKTGGGRQDMLIGYIRPWSKYSLGKYAVHVEFSSDHSIWKATVMND
ncbi:hypothetical protein [Pseudomonas asplenii]|uniref:hypothetical protein n=1 Tax=Pseudomonas asplenii TaxID=53407 RepID=UPI000B7FC029|nr:hypothetical protein [Pseudomonas asplenii]